MAMLGQSSFRRILLSRILLLSIPILLLGVGITVRKGRTSLLETARQNLTESATRKADDVQSSIRALTFNLITASKTSALQAGSPETFQSFLNQLASELPTEIQCLQLVSIETDQPIASTCGDRLLSNSLSEGWPAQQSSDWGERFRLHTLADEPALLPEPADPSSEPDSAVQQPKREMTGKLGLMLGTPVYDAAGGLKYALVAQATVNQRDSGDARSLIGYTVVIDENGQFLSHPLLDRVGRNIQDEGDADRLESAINNAQQGNLDFLHLFSFSGDGTEWLAGYSPVEIPISANETQTWTVLATTRLDDAIQGLEEITQILFLLTTGLLAAHLLAMLYMARDLALPIEQLGKYARQIHQRDPLERAPKNFRIRELNHLSEVLDNMVRRLEERARELESAWQEAEAANQLKSEFLANTSHELRTPLNAIIGCIRLVRDGCCDDKEEEFEFLERADEAAIHLLKIINDLLDIAKIEAGTLSLSMEQLDLRRLLGEVIDLQTVHVQQKGLELIVSELPEPIIVRTDPAKLKQVLLNVVYNAIKFTDQGWITIDTRIELGVNPVPVSSRVALQDSGEDPNPAHLPTAWVIVAVTDTGIGIDPNQQHKLFRPFVMVDGTTTRKFEGTGLGLAISRNLTELMGGSIVLHSAGLGQGTTVEIALPIADVSQLRSLTAANDTEDASEPSDSSELPPSAERAFSNQP